MSESTIRLQQHSDELISDEVKEIISYRPHWMIRKGNMIFFLVLVSLLALTRFIKYPDVVHGSARLVALNAPKLVEAKADGKIVKLLAINEQQVQKGQHLAVIESTADYKQVVALQKWIEEAIMSTANREYTLISQPLPKLYNLGELQTAYQAFQNQLVEIRQILASGYYEKKRKALQKDLDYISRLKNNTYQQQKLIEQDQQLQQKEYEAYEALAKDKVIAPLELNQYKSKLISKNQNLKQLNTQITNSHIATHNKQKEILDLQKTVFDQTQVFHSSLLELKSEIGKWIQQYVLIASENGKLLFTSSLQENELVSIGQGLFYIEPKQTIVYAELMASQRGLGKIKQGQKVMLKVESYPSNEFGHLIGSIDYISNIPSRKDSFLVKVSMPEGLKTSYGKQLLFRNNLSAQAEIITDNRKLFDRIAGELRQVLNRD